MWYPEKRMSILIAISPSVKPSEYFWRPLYRDDSFNCVSF
jgi:hypothetical protein